MSVRAKFKVANISRSMSSRRKRDADGKPVVRNGCEVYEPTEVQTIKLNPVYGNGDPNHENTKFYEASPGGSIELTTVRIEAAQYFELDAEYYIDFTKAPK